MAKAQSSQTLRAGEKIQKAYEVKDEGNGYFKSMDYQQAIKKYHHALLYVKGLGDKHPFQTMTGLPNDENNTLSEESKKSIKELEFICFNNLSACLLKRENFEKTVFYATKANELEPKNTKALFRRGTAYFHLKNFAKSAADFSKILSINPKETSVQKYLAVIEKENHKSLEKEKQMYSKMF